MKKKTPKRAKKLSRLTVLAPEKVPFRKSERSSIGRRERSSTITKPARPAAAAAKHARIGVDDQPYRFASTRANVRAKSALADVASPRRSRLRSADASRDSGT